MKCNYDEVKFHHQERIRKIICEKFKNAYKFCTLTTLLTAIKPSSYRKFNLIYDSRGKKTLSTINEEPFTNYSIVQLKIKRLYFVGYDRKN